MKKHIVFILAILIASAAVAQDGWKWPEDVETAKEKNAFYSDNVRSKDFASAVEPHQWLLDNCPDLNESLYINGAKIYEGLVASESDPDKKKEYQDIAMNMYDDRIKYFGNEAKVLNRKAFKAYKYYKGDRSKYKELFDLFNKAFELNGSKVLTNNLVAYIDVARRYKLTGGDVSDEEVIRIYGVISGVIQNKLAEKKGNESWLKKSQENVDKILVATVEVNCEFVEGKLVPLMKKDGKEDIKMAKMVIQLMLTAKCTDSPAFLEAGEMVFTTDPDAGLAKVLAIKYGAQKDYAKATEWYDKAIELTTDDKEKAEIYFNKAQTYSSQGAKSSARSSARKALQHDSSLKNAYKLIGNLYFSSYEDCRKGVSKVEDRLIFIAAFNQYAKAGDGTLMSKAKEQFPSISEIFELGLEEGQDMSTGCWINETVKLQRRPN